MDSLSYSNLKEGEELPLGCEVQGTPSCEPLAGFGIHAFPIMMRRNYVLGKTRRGMVALKLRPVGNFVGVVLPKEVLRRLQVSVGDMVYLTESPDGFRVTSYEPEFASQVSAAKKVMKRRRVVLRELAE
jgi:putative addiction module antidote